MIWEHVYQNDDGPGVVFSGREAVHLIALWYNPSIGAASSDSALVRDRNAIAAKKDFEKNVVLKARADSAYHSFSKGLEAFAGLAAAVYGESFTDASFEKAMSSDEWKKTIASVFVKADVHECNEISAKVYEGSSGEIRIRFSGVCDGVPFVQASVSLSSLFGKADG